MEPLFDPDRLPFAAAGYTPDPAADAAAERWIRRLLVALALLPLLPRFL